jgi:hypothetical protein
MGSGVELCKVLGPVPMEQGAFLKRQNGVFTAWTYVMSSDFSACKIGDS